MNIVLVQGNRVFLSPNGMLVKSTSVLPDIVMNRNIPQSYGYGGYSYDGYGYDGYGYDGYGYDGYGYDGYGYDGINSELLSVPTITSFSVMGGFIRIGTNTNYLTVQWTYSSVNNGLIVFGKETVTETGTSTVTNTMSGTQTSYYYYVSDDISYDIKFFIYPLGRGNLVVYLQPFANDVYCGKGVAGITDYTQLTLVSSELTNILGGSYYFTSIESNEKIYYIYPVRLGLITYSDNFFLSPPSQFIRTTISLQNSANYTESYYVLESTESPREADGYYHNFYYNLQ